MKITKLETLCLSRLHEPARQWVTARYRTIKADCAIVVISTDEGVQGIGEASAYGVPTLIEEWVAWLAPEMIGSDPNDPLIAPHPNTYTSSRAYNAAVGGIDSALWDLRAKLAGKRVSDLLASLLATQATDRVRLYASSGCRYDWRKNPEQLIEETLGYVEVGYTACKVRLGTEWSWDAVDSKRRLFNDS